MKKFFRYLLMIFVDLKKLAEAVNNVSTPSELDNIVLSGGSKNERKT